MIGNIALTLYISFVLGFTAFYIFARYSEWHWITKIITTIVSSLFYAIILPVICGVYIGIQYVNELEKEELYENKGSK